MSHLNKGLTERGFPFGVAYVGCSEEHVLDQLAVVLWPLLAARRRGSDLSMGGQVEYGGEQSAL